LNFHDALIALYCEEAQIRFIASFDQDFDQVAGLKRIANVEDLQSALASSTKTTQTNG
jgi:hypothetical protein